MQNSKEFLTGCIHQREIADRTGVTTEFILFDIGLFPNCEKYANKIVTEIIIRSTNQPFFLKKDNYSTPYLIILNPDLFRIRSFSKAFPVPIATHSKGFSLILTGICVT